MVIDLVELPFVFIYSSKSLSEDLEVTSDGFPVGQIKQVVTRKFVAVRTQSFRRNQLNCSNSSWLPSESAGQSQQTFNLTSHSATVQIASDVEILT